MREVLDRLREAETALDALCAREHTTNPGADLTRIMRRLWRAKYSLWRAQMHLLYAAAGEDHIPFD